MITKVDHSIIQAFPIHCLPQPRSQDFSLTFEQSLTKKPGNEVLYFFGVFFFFKLSIFPGLDHFLSSGNSDN